jgi:hypothetical protein
VKPGKSIKEIILRTTIYGILYKLEDMYQNACSVGKLQHINGMGIMK